MIRYILFTFAGVFLCIGTVIAQQDPLYTQYYFNPSYYNPAYTGVNDMMSLNAGYRHQTTGAGGGSKTAPNSFLFGVSTTFPNSNRAGIGLNISNDRIGVNNYLNINLALSYNLPLSDYTKLSFGLLGCLRNTSLNNNSLNYDPTQTLEDPNFPKGSYSAWSPNVGIGLWLSSENKYYVGVSVPKMLKVTSKDEQYVLNSTAQHFYFTGGYIINGEGSLPVRLSTMIRKVEGAPFSADVIGSIRFFDKLWGGVMVRNTPCIGVVTQLDINDHLQIAASYENNLGNDITLKDCFELQLKYNLAAFKLQTVMKPIF